MHCLHFNCGGLEWSIRLFEFFPWKCSLLSTMIIWGFAGDHVDNEAPGFPSDEVPEDEDVVELDSLLASLEESEWHPGAKPPGQINPNMPGCLASCHFLGQPRRTPSNIVS